MAAAISYFGSMHAPSICPRGTRADLKFRIEFKVLFLNILCRFSTAVYRTEQVCTETVQFGMCAITGRVGMDTGSELAQPSVTSTLMTSSCVAEMFKWNVI